MGGGNPGQLKTNNIINRMSGGNLVQLRINKRNLMGGVNPDQPKTSNINLMSGRNLARLRINKRNLMDGGNPGQFKTKKGHRWETPVHRTVGGFL